MQNGYAHPALGLSHLHRITALATFCQKKCAQTQWTG